MDKYTKLNTTSLSHIWKITSVEYFLNLSERLLSPIFTQKYKKVHICYQISLQSILDFYHCPKCFKITCKDIQIGLLFSKYSPPDIVLNVKYKIRGSKKKVTVSDVITNKLYGLQTFNICKNCETDINLKCSISYSTLSAKFIYESIPGRYVLLKSWEENVTEYLDIMYKTGIFSDMTIYVKDKPFMIHTPILCYYPYFKSLIIKAKNENSNRIDIYDVNPDLFDYMLCYIYTANENTLDSYARELLPIANRFGITNLEENCIKILQTKMNVDNVIDILIVANEINSDHLVADAIKFIVNYANDIKKTENYENLKRFYPDLMIELLNFLMTK
ncbi:speckle-type POZ protein B-like [Vespa crabro]|uniref:speckle-type POZ protein B-like n=1 Tax=Vespa crabro TaxID=7445 RepID=UPI001F0290EB|nr:speckle-type POZ protein B-like [Vespa crabro]